MCARVHKQRVHTLRVCMCTHSVLVQHVCVCMCARVHVRAGVRARACVCTCLRPLALSVLDVLPILSGRSEKGFK